MKVLSDHCASVGRHKSTPVGGCLVVTSSFLDNLASVVNLISSTLCQYRILDRSSEQSLKFKV